MEVSNHQLTVGPALQAVELAIQAIEGIPNDPGLFRLVQVENLLAGRDASSVLWRIGFKLSEVIPDEPVGKIGKGGELVFEVDTFNGRARQV